jgi:hypothetical protein
VDGYFAKEFGPSFYDLTAVGADQQGQGGTNFQNKKVYLTLYVHTDGDQATGRGPTWDDVKISCEPNILQGTEYQFLDGTSMATPHVAGAAALVASQYPAGNMNYLRSAILGSVVAMPALTSKTVTGGRLNVLGALDTQPPGAFDVAGPANGAVFRDRRPVLSWNATGDAKTGIAGYDLFVDNARAAGTDGSGRSAQPAADLADGPHTWSVQAIDGAGLRTSTPTRTLTVDTRGPKIKPPALGKPTLATLAKSGFSVPCALGEPGRCDLLVVISAADAKRLKITGKRGPKKGTVIIGRAKGTVGRSGRVVLRLRLARRLAGLIAKARMLKFTLTITAVDGLGNTTTITRVVTARGAPPRRPGRRKPR